MIPLGAVESAQAELAALADRVRGSTVQIQNGPGGQGAGLAWGGDLVLTNAHVAVLDDLGVVRPDGAQKAARLLIRDPRRDLALLQVGGLDLPPVSLGRADRLRPGMLVFAVGHPSGIIGALTAGVVHAVGTAGRVIPNGPAAGLRWLQADLEVAPGNSGGPVIDAEGQVVGITTMIAAGLMLAVPGEEALRWATRGLSTCRRFAS